MPITTAAAMKRAEAKFVELKADFAAGDVDYDAYRKGKAKLAKDRAQYRANRRVIDPNSPTPAPIVAKVTVDGDG